MAERITGHVWHRRQGYPWDEWLDGAVWRLTPGTDFTVSASSFTQAARMAAIRRDGHARTSQQDGHVIIQFTAGQS